MSMTLGKDVSALFPDVLKNIATADLDQKKLVYLYLMCVQLRDLNQVETDYF
jgi:AP-1 complex subunit beta-1